MGAHAEDSGRLSGELIVEIEMQGGVAIAREGKILGEMLLRICGLMTDELTGPQNS